MARKLRSEKPGKKLAARTDTRTRPNGIKKRVKGNRPTELRANGFGAVGCRCVLSKHP